MCILKRVVRVVTGEKKIFLFFTVLRQERRTKSRFGRTAVVMNNVRGTMNDFPPLPRVDGYDGGQAYVCST